MASATSVKAPLAVPASGATSVIQRAGVDLICAVLLAACGHLLIKSGLNAAPVIGHTPLVERILAYLLMPRVILGLAVYGLGTLLWIAVVSKRDISYLYPITALNYVLITMGGTWLFGEPVSWRRWLGIAVVMTGVAVLQASGGGKKQ